jgi:hypothetical protein
MQKRHTTVAGLAAGALFLGGAGAVAAAQPSNGPALQAPVIIQGPGNGPDVPGVPGTPESGDTPDVADGPDIPGQPDLPEPGDTPDAPTPAAQAPR